MARLRFNLGGGNNAKKELDATFGKALNAIGGLGLPESDNAIVVEVIRKQYATRIGEILKEVTIGEYTPATRKKAESSILTNDVASTDEVSNGEPLPVSAEAGPKSKSGKKAAEEFM